MSCIVIYGLFDVILNWIIWKVFNLITGIVFMLDLYPLFIM